MLNYCQIKNKLLMRFLSSVILIVFFSFNVSYAQAQTSDISDKLGSFKAKYDNNWQLRCLDNGDGSGLENEKKEDNSNCLIVQQLEAKQPKNLLITVVGYKIDDADNTPAMQIITPLGTFIPASIGLLIDKKKIGAIKYSRCFKYGCTADLYIDDNLMDELKKGKTAIFSIYANAEQAIGIPVKLKGFVDGLNAIK